MPAILKGWVDRVFAAGKAYGGGRWFESGVFRGKRAMCAITVGGKEVVFSQGGRSGPLSTILYPIHHGIFHFTGFAVIEPFVVYSPKNLSDDERTQELLRYRHRVSKLFDLPLNLPNRN